MDERVRRVLRKKRTVVQNADQKQPSATNEFQHLFTDYFFFRASCSAFSLALFSRMPINLALARAIRMLRNTLVFFSSSVILRALMGRRDCGMGITAPWSCTALASSAGWNLGEIHQQISMFINSFPCVISKQCNSVINMKRWFSQAWTKDKDLDPGHPLGILITKLLTTCSSRWTKLSIQFLKEFYFLVVFTFTVHWVNWKQGHPDGRANQMAELKQ